MVRESAVLVLLAALPGCSFILDFSDKAGVHDASLDGPCDYKEPNDSLDAAAVIDPATDMGPAAICKNAGGEDDDYYKFTVPATATKTTIKLMFTDSNVRDLDLKLYDNTGAQTAQSRSFSDGETLICPAVSPPCAALTAGADYTFEVLPGSPVNLNNYTFSVAFE
jgi:hypothetical protein